MGGTDGSQKLGPSGTGPAGTGDHILNTPGKVVGKEQGMHCVKSLRATHLTSLWKWRTPWLEIHQPAETRL